MHKLLLVVSTLFFVMAASAQAVPADLSMEEKLFGLSKVWKEVDKNFVFFEQVPALDWEATYQTYIPKVLQTESTYAYYKTLQEFCALLEDGHTRVVVPWQLRAIHEVAPPVVTEIVNGEVIIMAIRNDTVRQQGLREGMIISKIDGIDIHAYAQANVAPYVFASTEQDKQIRTYEYELLKGHIDQPVRLETTDGQTFTIQRRLTTAKKENPVYTFEVLPGNIGHLTISRFWGEDVDGEFDALYPDIQKTDQLIIDVSDNDGGSSDYAYYILSHLADKPFEGARWKSPMYIPAYASWGVAAQWLDNRGALIEPVAAADRYTKPVVVLISEKTYSAGEDFVAGFRSLDRGRVIGRPTAGSTGNPIGFALPGMGGLQICTKKDYLPDGREFVGFGIAPDVVIEKTRAPDHLVRAGLAALRD